MSMRNVGRKRRSFDKLGGGGFDAPLASLTPVARRVLEARYLRRAPDGSIETPRELFSRVAWAVAQSESKWWRRSRGGETREQRVERYAAQFYELMATLRFLPNSPTLMNAGRPRGQLSACFVLPIEDDLGKVFETLRHAAVIHKTGGGTGFNFGRLRPKGDPISSSGGSASGPLAFLRAFDAVTETVKQGGARRGANMAILPVAHPDIEDFVGSKRSGGIANFNISVGVSDSFMKAVKRNGRWDLRSPRDGRVVKTIRARALWEAIADAAWESGDPGIVFLDRIDQDNPTPGLGSIEATNPCGEQPLLPFESCNLGSLNLVAYARSNDFDWEMMERDVASCVRFLDNIIDGNSYPVLEIEEITLMNRKIGLGVMGWADVLISWGVPYDSDRAVELAGRTMERINRLTIRASEELAKERGPFPTFKESKWAKEGRSPRRNATVTTIAPTGTISIIAGVSSGIEPIFSLAYERAALDGESLVFIHPILKQVLRDANIRSRKTIERVIATGSVSAVEALPRHLRSTLKTAAQIKPTWHVRMQAIFQVHTENGVSKTINLPKEATPAEVKRIFELAYQLKCKGITVFRDSSKSTQVITRMSTHTNRRRSTERSRALYRKKVVTVVDWLLDGSLKHRSSRSKR